MLENTAYSAMFERMVLIRGFESRILELFAAGELNGTTHTYVGQEAIAVAVVDHLADNDIIFSSHRCHGHYLARFGDAEPLFAELMGRETGVCGGRGGSQHLCRGNFFSNGVQGGYVPIAVGMAFSEKLRQSGSIVVAFIGDGTLGEGNVYEAANLASLWQVPLLLVVENNRYAQTTPMEMAVAGSIPDRFAAFDIPVVECETNDLTELHPICGELVGDVRASGCPRVLVANTYRLNAHSKGDDFRSAEEIEEWWQRDPLKYVANRLEEPVRKSIEAQVARQLAGAEERARAAADSAAAS